VIYNEDVQLRREGQQGSRMQERDKGVKREGDGTGFAAYGQCGDIRIAREAGVFAERVVAPLWMRGVGGCAEVNESVARESEEPDFDADF